MRSRIKQIHFGLLVFLALNLLLQVIFRIEIDDRFVFILKVIAYTSGILLFFLTLKSKSFLKYYTSLFIISPIVVIISCMADGILGAILSSVFLGIWGPPASITDTEATARYGKYEIRSSFSGFLGGCCSYTLYEKKFLLFDRKIVDFRDSHSPSEILSFRKYPDRAIVYFKNEARDSTTVLIK
ncbi:hypothetical protein [Rufibacter aurantiacus]|uniref:hypothetical protein n=1 Tax=Rufibacter aurantiacus TaxID=2817374 RepID=UPI001B30F096|nr:hypothetical protein [Rufibacter aurantiacus]